MRKVGEKIAESTNLDTVTSAKECLDVIELSYKHLPDYLKPCLLYFASFQEDEKISFTNLAWLWTIEGFIPNTVVAESLLNDLIGRSLIMVSKKRSIGGVRTCHIHDVLHDFCVTKAKEEKFMQLASNGKTDFSSSFYENRRLCIDRSLYWAERIGNLQVRQFIPEIKRSDPSEVLRNQRLYGINAIMDIEPFKPRVSLTNKQADYMIKMANRLRKLKCQCKEPLKLRLDALQLETLSVNDVLLPQSVMSNIGRLPNLVVLKLEHRAFQQEKWDIEDEEFLTLKVLKLRSLKITTWNASDESLPNLEQLLVENCFHLQEIPSVVGEILTLKMIEVKRCGESLENSVRQIQEEQEGYGNEVLKVLIYPLDSST
ncbi:putative late blight resistance protein homolog R1B-16 [Solanum tuberosum]|uniref:putative late blight resistance protein homolog R1B-16 n=1 Tax=Solanum tuberosum TaxID=4113 RepID=UPI00073A24AB|nr:PREDICTED: putative late blight resistance protein homolog R1B-16 [Solanum tuberosum]